MYQEMRTKDDAWMQSIHESIDQLSEILDSMPKDGTALQNDDEYLCDKEVAYMLKVSRRTLSEYATSLSHRYSSSFCMAVPSFGILSRISDSWSILS